MLRSTLMVLVLIGFVLAVSGFPYLNRKNIYCDYSIKVIAVQWTTKDTHFCITIYTRIPLFKLLSQPWWILIPKFKQIKINSSISQIIIINNTSLNFIEIPRCRSKNVKQIHAFSGPVRILDNGIPFTACQNNGAVFTK